MPGVTTAYQTGVHGSRPANGAGCILYSCTTHGLIYRDDGTSWTTFLTTTSATRASLGLDTTDSPEFAGLNIGHASDTTLTRASAGNLAVEGNTLYRAGGTDVAITDGGTGASTATAGFDALSPMTTAGDLIIGGASGTRTRLAAGATSGHVLTSTGSGSAPSWQAASGGGITQSYLGYNTVGGTEETATVFRYIGKSFTPGSNGFLLSMEVYTRETADGLNRWGAVIHDNNAGAIGKIIAFSTVEQTAFTNNSTFGDGSTTSIARWVSIPLGLYLASGTTYWGGIFLNASSANFRMFYDGSGTDRRYDSSGDFIADGGRYTQTDTTRKYSIRFLFLS